MPETEPAGTAAANRAGADAATAIVPAAAGEARAPDQVTQVAAMRWPGGPERDAAEALDAIARRLRGGTLRLPFAIDTASRTAVLAVVLAALHAEPGAGARGVEAGG